MLLPNASLASVAESKIIKYLLDDTHPEGKGKAKFFLSMGFSKSDWMIFRDALLHHCTVSRVVSTRVIPNFPAITVYELSGELETPIGRIVLITSAWKIDINDPSLTPNFVSAYPKEANK